MLEIGATRGAGAELHSAGKQARALLLTRSAVRANVKPLARAASTSSLFCSGRSPLPSATRHMLLRLSPQQQVRPLCPKSLQSTVSVPALLGPCPVHLATWALLVGPGEQWPAPLLNGITLFEACRISEAASTPSFEQLGTKEPGPRAMRLGPWAVELQSVRGCPLPWNLTWWTFTALLASLLRKLEAF
jgi:hypothetical protein